MDELDRPGAQQYKCAKWKDCTTGWIRRLGGRNWNLLHKLIYLTAIAAVLHYYWKVSIKLPPTNPLIYAGIVAFLLGFRVWRYFARRPGSKV